MQVKKRNGNLESFDSNKIFNAIQKASSFCNVTIPKTVINDIVNDIDVYEGIPIEDIQNQIEDLLISFDYPEVYKVFSTYRANHAQARFIKERIDYMNKYKNPKINASTASETDSNANVAMKNVANLEGEVYKTTNRIIQRQRMKEKLSELYPNENLGEQYINDLESHIIYTHDEASTPVLKPYTYSPFETIEVKYNDLHLLISLQSLYDTIHVKEVLEDSENGIWCKYPSNLYVKDKDGWTKINRLTKKKRHRDLVYIKTVFGQDIIVTDNHPMIINDDINNTKPAIEVAGENQFYLNNTFTFEGIDTIDLSISIKCKKVYSNYISMEEEYPPLFYSKRYIKVNKDLGYTIGFIIGDSTDRDIHGRLTFISNNKHIITKLSEAIFESFGTILDPPRKLSDGWNTTLYNNIIIHVLYEVFNLKYLPEYKCLPHNLLMYTEDFAKGIIEGLIDSNSEITNSNTIQFKFKDRELALQISKLFCHFGYNVNIRPLCTDDINSNYSIWNVECLLTTQSVEFDNSYKFAKNINKDIDKVVKHSSGWNSITNLTKINGNSFLKKCQYIYDITTISHTFNCNDLWAHNCAAITTYPLLVDGVGNIDGVTPSAPNDIASFSGQITNLVFLISSQLKGAVAIGDYFIALNYYVVKQFGDKWYDILDKSTTTENCLQPSTVRRDILKGMKQFIYGVNQPAGNRSYNSPFTNVSYYDKYYFKSLFEYFYYPDGTQPEWKAIDTLQRMFMQLHRELRLIKPLTFPVSTIALVHNNKEYLDSDYKELAAEEWAKGGSFFCYNNDNPTSLASCCFSKDTKVLWKSNGNVHCTTFKELYDNNIECIEVLYNGSWVKGKSIKLPNRKLYSVITSNKKEIVMTDNHINVTLDDEKFTSELTKNDYLLFNSSLLNGEYNDYSFNDGYLLGLFINSGIITNDTVEFFMTDDMFQDVIPYLNACSFNVEFETNKIKGKEFIEFLNKWTNNTSNTYIDRDLNLDCILQSTDFRFGILEGCGKKCISENVCNAFEVIALSLGMQFNIIKKEVENGFVMHYILCNMVPLDFYKIKDGNIYFKITEIKELSGYEDDVYCIECEDKPYFTLPSGLVTHNCRVLNEMSDNTFSSTTGMTGIMTGSANVITLNINRITQNYFRSIDFDYSGIEGSIIENVTEEDMQGFKDYLINILERVYKYHIAYKTMLYDMESSGMFSECNAGYIYINKLYSTIGLIGYSEAAQYLGLEISNNDLYKKFLQLIFGTIKEQNKLHSIHNSKQPFLFNSEAIPGENLGVKLYEWDKKDGYVVPANQNLYNCYFYNPWNNTNVLDKFKLHGKDIAKYCDGGLTISLAS